ncbi:hypothetical protein MFIFM68171_02154 [Madurella fahalii]|uniref:Uncharacterized protein n=1 Tax=Madurella fahalii TaxID=1157608 RepID=A0ABQ0G2H4_9PEZI
MAELLLSASLTALPYLAERILQLIDQPTNAQEDRSHVVQGHPARQTPPANSTAPGSTLQTDRSAPSLLIKAYMIALKSNLSPEPNLSDVDQSIFVALPPEKGVPVNVADEYLNEMVYQHANAVQQEHHIAFKPSGDFFQYMNDFVAQSQLRRTEGPRNHVSTNESLSEELKAYLSARRKADKEFEKLLINFKSREKLDSSYQFQQHLQDHGDDYREAWDARNEAASKLEPTDLVRSMQILDSAQARAEPLHGQNMRSTLKTVNFQSPDREVVSADDIFYRPLHTLFGYRDAVAKWTEEWLTKRHHPSEIELDLLAAVKTPWRELGFPTFDAGTPTDALESTVERLVSSGLKVALTYTHLESFRVIRGLWNVQDFREVLGAPGPDAKPNLMRKVYKTTRLLFAYGIQITLKGLKGLEGLKGLSDMVFITSGVPLAKISDDESGTKTPRNDAYPLLLAVLAEKC